MTDSNSTEHPPRRDLAAMLLPLFQALVATETPILKEHGTTMWAYAVLCALHRQPMRTQSALARSIGADKTRIIRDLDELQERGLIEREPDPNDRRARLLRLTPAGERLREDITTDIQTTEGPWLELLPAGRRREFLTALETLSTAARETIERT